MCVITNLRTQDFHIFIRHGHVNRFTVTGFLVTLETQIQMVISLTDTCHRPTANYLEPFILITSHPWCKHLLVEMLTSLTYKTHACRAHSMTGMERKIDRWLARDRERKRDRFLQHDTQWPPHITCNFITPKYFSPVNIQMFRSPSVYIQPLWSTK